MFQWLIRLLGLQPIAPDPPKSTEKPMPEILPTFPSAVNYNQSKVAIFAPSGFPEWTGIVSAPDSEQFTGEVGKVQGDLGLTVDGYCGPNTINAIAWEDSARQGIRGKAILVGARAFEVSAPVSNWIENKDLDGLGSRGRSTAIRMITLHYDVTYNSKSTLSVLRKRGTSYHFLVDGDPEASVYQTMNPTTHVAFHGADVNNYSLGICMNNPADPTYQDEDFRRRGVLRQAKTEFIHGAKTQLLEFFPQQVEVCREITKTLCSDLGVPFDVPRNDKGVILKGLDPNYTRFKGVCGHYHITKRKIDPSPLDWKAFLEE